MLSLSTYRTVLDPTRRVDSSRGKIQQSSIHLILYDYGLSKLVSRFPSFRHSYNFVSSQVSLSSPPRFLVLASVSYDSLE